MDSQPPHARPLSFGLLFTLASAFAFAFSATTLTWSQTKPAPTGPAPDPPPKPNVVLIFTDDQGVGDVGCYGSEIPTPNIDRLAAEGMRFDRWYSASAICTPSRFGLLTGRNPSRSRDGLLSALMFMSEEHGDRGIRPDETTIATRLRAAGYHTALVGKWHLGHGDPGFLPTRHGFDTFVGHTGGCIDYFTMTYGEIPDWYRGEQLEDAVGYATEIITDEAVQYLEERAAGDKPFFLYLAYNAPHFAKGFSPNDGAPVNIMQAQAADLRRVSTIGDKTRREFAAMTVSLDDGVGRVLDALDEYELADDTLVVFLTDHGGDPVYGGNNHPLRGDKATLFEGGLRVPCLMRWPGHIEPGTRCDAVTSSLDLFPTLCTLAGTEPDAGTPPPDGLDLTPVLFGQGSLTEPRTLFWELGTHGELGRSPWSALLQGDWKLVSPPGGSELLFDLDADPNESRDLAGEQPQRLAAMQAERDRIAREMRPEASGR